MCVRTFVFERALACLCEARNYTTTTTTATAAATTTTKITYFFYPLTQSLVLFENVFGP